MEAIPYCLCFWFLKCETPIDNSNEEVGAMLRIAITELPGEQRWSLQGQLVGQWAAELKSTWERDRQMGDMRKCIVELMEVTAIDRNGEGVLAEIMRQGAEFIAADVYTKHLLVNMRKELKQSRKEGKQDEKADHDEVD
jgi:hypothetical protein